MLWIALAGGILGLYVVGELLGRWWLRSRSRYYVCLPGLRLHLHLDRSVLPELEPTVRFEVNSDGERGAEVRGAPPGLYRVLAAGGSAVEGYLLDQATCWPMVLERILNQPEALNLLGAGRVHIGSIGRTSVASRDLDLVLERVLPQYRRLDALVIMIGASDVLKWLEYGAPVGSAAPPAPVSALFARHPEGPFGWHPSRSALFDVLKRCRRWTLRPVDVRHHVGRSLAESRAMRAAATEVRTTLPDPSPMLENFERCFRRVLRTATARARLVLVARQPWFEKEYSSDELAHFWDGAAGQPWKQHVDVYYSVDVVNRLMALLDARAAQVAEELGVEHLDLRSLLEPSLATYYDHWHFTPAGARRAAEAVAAALLRQGAHHSGRSPDRLVRSAPTS